MNEYTLFFTKSVYDNVPDFTLSTKNRSLLPIFGH